MTPQSDWERMQRGEIITIGGKLMTICRDCGKLIRMDKPIFGSWHICATDEEIAQRRRQ